MSTAGEASQARKGAAKELNKVYAASTVNIIKNRKVDCSEICHPKAHPGVLGCLQINEVCLKQLLCFFVFAPTLLMAQSRQSLKIDPRASTLTWTGHAEVGPYAPSGSLKVQEGSILFENGSLFGASLVIDMNSMTQSNADLLHHLKSSDFFDVEHYPVALIKIDRIDNGTVYGTMTLKGKSAPLKAPVTVKDANGRFSIVGKVSLDRTQYGIVYNSSSFFSNLGDKAIRNTFEVEFALNGSGEIPAKYCH